jgi:hypothetical protein
MIRFLQRDNRVTKALLRRHHRRRFGVHGGLPDSRPHRHGSLTADTYAVIYPHWYSRFLSSGDDGEPAKVSQLARQQLQQRSPQYADNPMIERFYRAAGRPATGAAADSAGRGREAGHRATDDDVSQYLHQGHRRGSLPQRQVHRRRPVRRFHLSGSSTCR